MAALIFLYFLMCACIIVALTVSGLCEDPATDCEVYKKEGCAHVDCCDMKTCETLQQFIPPV